MGKNYIMARFVYGALALFCGLSSIGGIIGAIADFMVVPRSSDDMVFGVAFAGIMGVPAIIFGRRWYYWYRKAFRPHDRRTLDGESFNLEIHFPRDPRI